ncbi:RNA polymerase sigma factor [Paraburkholderia acidiphila]|uniref:RNA polymerase sigma factor n=1 Tax=Paraburkholderia acidiphila TaxID=2571747 RepID=UPI0018EF1002|nr:sigma factor [Paraburkholderia acidiphila]
MPDTPTNPEDFDTLLGTLRPRLHRYCARMTGSVIDGEDVVQDTLLNAYEARCHRWRDRESGGLAFPHRA